MFFQVLKQFFWDLFDHLGRLLTINLLLVLTVLPACLFSISIFFGFLHARPELSVPYGLVLILLLLPFFGALVFSGLLTFGHDISLEKDPPLRRYFTGICACGGRVFHYLAFSGAVLGLVWISLWFYCLSDQLPESMRYVGYGIGGICLWIGIGWIGMMIHALPIVAREKKTLRAVMKQSFLLLLRYPFLTFGVFLAVVLFMAAGVALRLVGVVLFGFTLPALMINSLHDVIFDFEAQRAELAAESDGNQSMRPASWKQIHAKQAEREEEKMKKSRYNRGWADIMRPWEM